MNDLATTGDTQLGELLNVAEVFAKSGIFPDARDYNLCAAKLIVGNSMGLNSYESMTGLNFIKGKPTLAAATMASAIKRSGKYDYRAQKSATECRITFYDVTGSEPRSIGTSHWTLEMAKRAGLGGDNWRKYPEAMLFARCISDGYKTHCPDALGQAAVYVEAHGEHEIPGEPVTTIESVEAVVEPAPDPEPAPEPAPVKKSKPKALPASKPPADEGEQTEQYDKIRVHSVKPTKRGTKTKQIVYGMDGTEFETFSKSIAKQCVEASADELDVHVTWLPTKIGSKVFREIQTVAVEDPAAPTTEKTEEDW